MKPPKKCPSKPPRTSTEPPLPLDAEDLLALVIEIFHTSHAELCSRSQIWRAVQARWAFWWFCYHGRLCSKRHAASFFHKDRNCVVNALSHITNRAARDPAFLHRLRLLHARTSALGLKTES